MRRISLPARVIAARYAAGENSYKLGRAYGVDHGTILKRLRELGVTLRRGGTPRAELPEAELIRRYAKGEGTPALARAYGVSERTICLRLRALDVRMRPPSYWHKPGGPRWLSSLGYSTTTNRDGAEVLIHRACWEAYNGPIPAGRYVHHINRDRADSRIENLQLVTPTEHGEVHANREERT